MTNTDGGSKILKTDALGRVRTPAARREQLLDEFERSGVSGAKFAGLTGLKYQTFASWVQRRRRGPTARANTPGDPASTVRWLEAVVGTVADNQKDPALPLHLPGGTCLEISCAAQIPLAAALLRALEKAGAC